MKEEFKEVHSCTKRIEDKVSELITKIDPVLDDYRDRQKQKEQATLMRWDVKKAVVASALGVIGSIATAAIIIFVGLR